MGNLPASIQHRGRKIRKQGSRFHHPVIYRLFSAENEKKKKEGEKSVKACAHGLYSDHTLSTAAIRMVDAYNTLWGGTMP